VRKVLLIIGLLAALAVPAGAVAAKPPTPYVLCGAACGDPGGGWTGCTSQTESHSASVPFVASIRHFLVVNYCKRYGVITSVSIAAHGCDASGFGACSVGPAWQTGGGVGAGSASFEGHAQWSLTVVPIWNNYDIVTVTIPYG
jgi:hypothetical protein